MTPARKLSKALFAVLILLAVSACGGEDKPKTYIGYVEGDFVLVGADESGRLEKLMVEEGDTIQMGAPLFALESKHEEAALAAAQARLEQAEASLALAKVGLERAKKLFKRGVVPRSRLDDAQSAFDTGTAAAAAGRADVEDARTRLDRRRVAAPVTGSVQEVYYRPGEIVAAGRPIVSLLPPRNIKVRFYVPEPDRPAMQVGRTIGFSCDGCGEGMQATISFVSNEAEYAPPVIFSREERSKLLYMIEARPKNAAFTVPIGQPVTVTSGPGQ